MFIVGRRFIIPTLASSLPLMSITAYSNDSAQSDSQPAHTNTHQRFQANLGKVFFTYIEVYFPQKYS